MRPIQIGCSVLGGLLAEHLMECVNECQSVAMLNEVCEELTAVPNSQALDELSTHMFVHSCYVHSTKSMTSVSNVIQWNLINGFYKQHEAACPSSSVFGTNP